MAPRRHLTTTSPTWWRGLAQVGELSFVLVPSGHGHGLLDDWQYLLLDALAAGATTPSSSARGTGRWDRA